MGFEGGERRGLGFVRGDTGDSDRGEGVRSIILDIISMLEFAASVLSCLVSSWTSCA